MDGRTDRLTDGLYENIILPNYRVAGYKNGNELFIYGNILQLCSQTANVKIYYYTPHTFMPAGVNSFSI